MTKEGTFEKAPQTDEEWNQVKASAMAILEVGNLLMIPARSGGNDEWNQLSLDMIAQTKRVIQAAEKHDKQGVFNTGADIYDACVNCHKRFDPGDQGRQVACRCSHSANGLLPPKAASRSTSRSSCTRSWSRRTCSSCCCSSA